MLDTKTIEGLKEKHGAVADMEAPDGRTIVIKRPKGHVYNAFMGKVTKDGANKATALLDLVRECVVYPESETEIADILDTYPAMVGPLSGAITEMAGGTGEARLRKN